MRQMSRSLLDSGNGLSQRRPDLPGDEFFVAEAVQFAFGFFAAGDCEDLFEDFAADLFDAAAGEDFAGVDVHVVDHPLVHRRVGGDLDRRAGLAAVAAAAAGGEDHDVARRRPRGR